MRLPCSHSDKCIYTQPKPTKGRGKFESLNWCFLCPFNIVKRNVSSLEMQHPTHFRNRLCSFKELCSGGLMNLKRLKKKTTKAQQKHGSLGEFVHSMQLPSSADMLHTLHKRQWVEGMSLPPGICTRPAELCRNKVQSKVMEKCTCHTKYSSWNRMPRNFDYR